VIEVKWRLTRATLFAAAGQVLVYRQSFDPATRAIIVGYATSETAALLPHLAGLGVEVVCWRDAPSAEERGLHAESGAPRSAAARTPPPALAWSVAQLASACGIPNVPKLAFRLRAQRQAIYALWDGRAKSISLLRYGQLCLALGAAPGDWFTWAET